MIIIGFCQSVAAQSYFSMGPTVGLGATTIINTPTPGVRIAANAGLTFIYNVSEHVDLEFDIMYSAEGEKGDIVPYNNSIIVTSNLHYFRLPVKATYLFYEYNKKIRPKIFAGPSFGYLIGGKTELQTINNRTPIINSKVVYKPFDVGVVAGVGFNHMLNEYTWINADVSYFHGLPNNRRNTDDDHNRNLMLNVAMIFSL